MNKEEHYLLRQIDRTIKLPTDTNYYVFHGFKKYDFRTPVLSCIKHQLIGVFLSLGVESMMKELALFVSFICLLSIAEGKLEKGSTFQVKVGSIKKNGEPKMRPVVQV